jgi:hypothetical protein
MRAGLVLISVIAWALSAHAAEVLVHSRETLIGRDRSADLDFSAVEEEPQVVRVEILRPGKQFMARIDYGRQTLAITSVAPETSAAVPIMPADNAVFTRVLRSIALDRSRVADALISTLTWLAEHPPQAVVDLRTEGPTTPRLAPQGAPTQGYTSLCESIGQAVIARYTVDGEVHEELVVVGPCGANDCLGRCGAGCLANPGNPAEVNRYTQECLNHDVCNWETNPWDALGLFPPCRDEFEAAAEGYFFAPDCPQC